MGLFRMLFKLLFFPFKIVRNIFASGERRHYYEMKDGIKHNIEQIRDQMGKKGVTDEDKQVLQENLSKAKQSLRNVRKWHRRSMSLHNDPDSRSKFRRAKRSEWNMRKNIGGPH